MKTHTGCRPGRAKAPVATRRRFLAGAAALGTASGSGVFASLDGASAQGAAAPRGGEFVIRGGYIITMDKAAGDIPVGDVHVRNGTIAGIAPSISAPGAEVIDAQNMIVMPGFIETHSHCWNALLKNMRRPGVDYFRSRRCSASSTRRPTIIGRCGFS
jgi:5-methylthioadenosine/S-adenosylhomocysteine deaminase